MTSWKELPTQFAYLQPWAEKFGVRGLTIYNKVVPVSKYASRTELAELCEAYEAIAERGNIDELIEWCHSIETGTPANDAREAVRGLLLHFERLAEYDIQPFTDGQVRYVDPHEEPYTFDWTRLPAEFQHLIPWLNKFEHLRSEIAVYEYAAGANEQQRVELLDFKALLARNDGAFAIWCIANDKDTHPAKWEIFQAGWMFLLVDFVMWEKNPDGTLKFPG
jgi:hypothetical protein